MCTPIGRLSARVAPTFPIRKWPYSQPSGCGDFEVNVLQYVHATSCRFESSAIAQRLKSSLWNELAVSSIIMSVTQESYIFQAVVAKQAPNVIGGQGIHIQIENPDTGKVTECIDAITGAAVGALGWKDPAVPGFFAEAFEKSTYSFTAAVGNKNAEALAKFLVENSPKGAFGAALFVCSGSEANDNAMKISRQYWVEKGKPKKVKFIGRECSYHGFTIGAMSLSRGFRSDAFKEISLPSSQSPTLDVCYPYREQGDLTSEEYVQKLLDQAEKLILQEDPETIASIVVETLPGSTLGTVPPPPGYLPGLRRLCDKYDILFHLDEVMCGTGRCNNGGLHCWENFLEPGQSPDIQTIGKTLGSGYVTIAGVLVSPKIRDTFISGSGMVIGGMTYAGHALNTYVALKIQERIKALKLSANMFKMGNLLGELLTKELASNPLIGEVRGIGGFWTAEIVKNRETKESFAKELDVSHRVLDLALANGLNVMAIQGCNKEAGDHMLLGPAFTVTEEEIREIVKRAKVTFAQLAQALSAEGLV